jgi:hypothetical protein
MGVGGRRNITRLFAGSVVTMLLLGGARAAAALPPDGLPRVRSSHAYLRAMIDEAIQRSSTFRALVEAIEATNGIVYVEHGSCGHSVRACLSLSVTPAAEFRILRVLVDARQPDWEVMASIGHELRHALEVLGETTATTSEAVYLVYVREGATTAGGTAFETAAATRAGNAVKNDVVSFARTKWK